jgi:4-hydroxy-tetrahydrodipicolinate synthase
VSELAAAGVDIVVLVVPALLDPGKPESVLRRQVDALIRAVPDATLGICECPRPHHRILSIEAVQHLARTGRFAFFKEMSHDVAQMRERVRVGAPHGLHILNAGIENYAESLAVGVSGLSGWVANVAPGEVARLTALALAGGTTDEALALQETLVHVEKSMGPTYPSSAKAIVNVRAGTCFTLRSRWRPTEVDPALIKALATDLANTRERGIRS